MNRLIKILMLVPFVAFIVACQPKEGNGTDAANVVSADSAAIPVSVIPLVKTDIALTIDYSATVQAYEEVNMAPSMPGRIEKIFVEVGDRVKKGDNLFQMDRTQLLQTKLQFQGLAKDLARLDTLLLTGSVRQQQYDQMKLQYDVTKSNMEYMEENTLLEAPFNGIVTGKYFENGEMYSGAPTTMTGKSAVVTVMQVSPLKVIVSISEQYYPQVRKGMKATVTSDIYPSSKFEGKVTLVHPTVNAMTRSFNVEIEINNDKEILKPGMYVKVSMLIGEINTFVVPANTVMVQEGTNNRYIFIAENGKARRIKVIMGKRFDEKLEIRSEELTEGVNLVIEGQAKLSDGVSVKVIK